MLPSTSQSIAVPAATDWIAVSKTLAIEAVFVASTATILLGHGSPDIIQIVWATGTALGVLRVADIVANVVNVRSFLNKPDSGVVPQAVGTPLIQTQPPLNGGSNASSPAA